MRRLQVVRVGSTVVAALVTLAIVGCAKFDGTHTVSATAPSAAVGDAPPSYDGTGTWHAHGIDHVGNIVDFNVVLSQDVNGNLSGTVSNGESTIEVRFIRDGNGKGETVTYKLAITSDTSQCPNLTSRGTAKLDTDTNVISVVISGTDPKCNFEPGISLTFTKI